jgi:CHAD domain-containing protein
MELVPMSIAAMRMRATGDSSSGAALACYISVIYWRACRPNGGHPTMTRRRNRVPTLLLERQSRALKRHLPGAVKGDDRAVHQARVASRRLRESVPVLSHGLKGSKRKKARRKIRRLTGALGIVRELDVALKAVDELASSGDVPRAATDELRAHVLAERQKRRESMLERLDQVNADKLHRRLASVAAALSEAGAEPWRDVLGKRLLKRAKRLASAVDEAGHLYAPERLHQVRIAAKKLRYGLEMAAEAGVRAASPLVRTLKRAQELLGRIQDLQVLQEHVSAIQADSNGHRAPRAAFDTLARRIEDECRRLHGRHVADAHQLSEAAAQVRSTVVPLLAHPPRRSRPVKMSLARGALRRRAGTAG